MRTLLLSCAALALFGLPAGAADRPAANEITLVVMDPLALDLSCPCVAGYAQRDYHKLAKFLGQQVGRPVKVHFSETLSGALTKKTAGKADLIIGKDSVVLAGAKENKLTVTRVAALTGKDGKTTQTGLIIVPAKDAALTLEDIKGHKVLFGPSDCDEKHAAPLALLKDFQFPLPKTLDTAASCTTCATQVLADFKKGVKVAGVVSSYAQPLLEGCGTIKKGELRVVGETDPVPFIAAFTNDKLPAADRAALQKALLAVAKDAELCKVMESKKGFIAPPVQAAGQGGAKKK